MYDVEVVNTFLELVRDKVIKDVVKDVVVVVVKDVFDVTDTSVVVDVVLKLLVLDCVVESENVVLSVVVVNSVVQERDSVVLWTVLTDL